MSTHDNRSHGHHDPEDSKTTEAVSPASPAGPEAAGAAPAGQPAQTRENLIEALVRERSVSTAAHITVRAEAIRARRTHKFCLSGLNEFFQALGLPDYGDPDENYDGTLTSGYPGPALSGIDAQYLTDDGLKLAIAAEQEHRGAWVAKVRDRVVNHIRSQSISREDADPALAAIGASVTKPLRDGEVNVSITFRFPEGNDPEEDGVKEAAKEAAERFIQSHFSGEVTDLRATVSSYFRSTVG